MEDQVHRFEKGIRDTDITGVSNLSFCHSGSQVNPLYPIMQA
jgi:hypothetical protein